MSSPGPVAFDKEHAANYDAQWKPLAALSGALHLLTRSVLGNLPPNARILCAGVGTVAELLYLADAFPEWRFVGFDPAEAMLAVCRNRVEAAGVAARCELHHGYIETLPESEPFDAATSFLVSHFLTDTAERNAYFTAIADRLSSGALFANADLVPDFDDHGHEDLMQVWLGVMALAGSDAQRQEKYKEMFGKAVAAHTPQEVEQMIKAGGFTKPVRYYQAAMIQAWFCRRLPA